MYFKFLNYVSPAWYFNLQPVNHTVPYHVNYSLLSEEEKGIIAFDENYSSTQIAMLDAAYQAWHKGIIKTDMHFELPASSMKPALPDEYYFIRKYFKSFWAVYILMLRIVTFHNPFKEVRAFYRTRNRKKSDVGKPAYFFKEYKAFQSSLVASTPFISVIIPTLNRYKYLDDVLNDLEAQDYKNFEVIVIDQSTSYNPEFYTNRKLDLIVMEQREQALWLARNEGIKKAKGTYFLFYDDDSRVESDWITQHLKTLDFFKADISSGVSLSVHGADVPFSYSFFKWSDQIDTGNFLIEKSVFQTTGLFDRQFEKQRMGDGEFGLRCYLNGFKNISNPYAKRIHLKVSEGGLRQMGSWDAFRTKKLMAPRPIPSVNYFIRKYFGNANAIYNLLINIPPSLIPYKFKRNRTMLIVGSFLSLFVLPFMLIPVFTSWINAGKMMKEGAKIEPWLNR